MIWSKVAFLDQKIFEVGSILCSILQVVFWIRKLAYANNQRPFVPDRRILDLRRGRRCMRVGGINLLWRRYWGRYRWRRSIPS